MGTIRNVEVGEVAGQFGGGPIPEAYEDFFESLRVLDEGYTAGELTHDEMYDGVMIAVDAILEYRARTGDRSVGTKTMRAE